MLALRREPAYGQCTEIYSSIVIKDGVVPGEEPLRSALWKCQRFEEPGLLVTSPSDVGDARLRVEAVAAGSAARVIIEGEADVANVTHLETALENIDLDGAQTVELHVSDLTFIDVAALRGLTRFAVGLKRGGRHVITSGARPTLRRMALELDVQEELGLP
jgi:hypothetical protein